MKIKLYQEDRLFSLFVRCRARWRCEKCGKIYPPGARNLQCSHFFGRRKKSTRFDPDNASGLCFACHQRFTEHPLEHVKWFEKRLGQKRFEALTLRANTPKKPDLKMVELFCKHEIKKMRYAELL